MNQGHLDQLHRRAEELRAAEDAKTPEEKQHKQAVLDLADSFLEVIYNHRQSEGGARRWRVNYKMSTGQIMPLVNINDGELAKAQMRGIMTDFFMRAKDLK